MLGFAMGCVGMTYDDFCGLTPEEFRHVADAYHDRQEADSREAWERLRTLAAISIQPHIRRKLTPQQLLPLPWDKPKRKKTQAPAVSKEEALTRFKRLTGKS